jgi:uncharacterized protein
MNVVRAFLALSLLLLAPAASAEEMSAEKRADIEKLIQITGAANVGKQMAGMAAGQMVQLIKQARPDIPAKTLDVVPREVEAVFAANEPSFWEQVIPLYDKYFTGAELKEMLRFYNSPLGKKTVKVMPSLMAEGMKVGQKWGESLGPQVAQRVKARLEKEGVKL